MLSQLLLSMSSKILTDNDDVFQQSNETDFDGITAKAESNIASLFQTKKT